jgi:chaperonin cofactor prefoldin
MTFKTAAKSVGNGLLTATTVLHNSGLQTRINAIDEELETLQAQVDKLKEERSNLEAQQI